MATPKQILGAANFAMGGVFAMLDIGFDVALATEYYQLAATHNFDLNNRLLFSNEQKKISL